MAACALSAVMGFFLRGGPYLSLIMIFVCVPRLHDIGRTGWFALGLWVAEVQVEIQLFPYRPTRFIEAPTMSTIVLAVAVVAVLVCLGLIPGQPGANKFGPPCRPGLKGQLVGAGQ